MRECLRISRIPKTIGLFDAIMTFKEVLSSQLRDCALAIAVSFLSAIHVARVRVSRVERRRLEMEA